MMQAVRSLRLDHPETLVLQRLKWPSIYGVLRMPTAFTLAAALQGFSTGTGGHDG